MNDKPTDAERKRILDQYTKTQGIDGHGNGIKPGLFANIKIGFGSKKDSPPKKGG